MSQGVIKSDITMDGETLVHRQSQPTEDLILNRNAELRKNEGAIQDLGSRGPGGAWGRQVASIPFIMYQKAIRDGYQLNSKNAKHAQKELFRYLQSDEGKKCLIRGKL